MPTANSSNAIAIEDGTGEELTSYTYSKDVQGSIMELVGADEKSVAGYQYDACGNTTISGKQTTANELAYTGGVYDKTTEEYYLNARYYDPADGRFLTQDTYHGEDTQANTWNLYSYCGGNPVNYVDPSGYCPFSSKTNFSMVRRNYNKNIKNDFFGKYIYGQKYGSVSKMRFQDTTIGDMGCGAVAVYNALLYYWHRPKMSMVIKDIEEANEPMEKGGTMVASVIDVLKKHNIFHSHAKVNNETVRKKLNTGKDFILYYKTDKNSGHYIFGCKVNSHYRLWNAGMNDSKYRKIKKARKRNEKVKSFHVEDIKGLRKVEDIILLNIHGKK